MLKWERGKVAKYGMLRNISKEVWNVIVPTFEDIGTSGGDDDGTRSVPTGTVFTEGLLRSILDLTPNQQLELVQALASGTIQKGKFKTLAESYRARNEMKGIRKRR